MTTPKKMIGSHVSSVFSRSVTPDVVSAPEPQGPQAPDPFTLLARSVTHA